MVSPLLLAALLATAPTEKPPKPPKRTPEERLARADDARVALNLGGRVYGRFLSAPPAYGGALQLGVGVRVVRGLYIAGEVDAGAHAMPFGAQGQVFLGLRHELRMSKWVRPSFSLGYSHLIDASFDARIDPLCGCTHDPDFEFNASSDVDLAQRHGIEGGIVCAFRSAGRRGCRSTCVPTSTTTSTARQVACRWGAAVEWRWCFSGTTGQPPTGRGGDRDSTTGAHTRGRRSCSRPSSATV